MSTKGTVAQPQVLDSALRAVNLWVQRIGLLRLSTLAISTLGVECQRCGAATRWNTMFCPTCGFDSPYNATMKSYSESSVPRQKGKAGDKDQNIQRGAASWTESVSCKKKKEEGQGQKRSKKGKERGKVEAQDHERAAAGRSK